LKAVSKDSKDDSKTKLETDKLIEALKDKSKK